MRNMPPKQEAYIWDVKFYASHPKTKFQVHGEEMLAKTVSQSGKSGRVYLPLEWLGKRVKIIRID